MQLQDLEKVRDLSYKLAEANDTLNGVMASDGTSFPSYAKHKRGVYGAIELPAVSREVVLDASRAARDAIVQQLKDLGVDAGGAHKSTCDHVGLGNHSCQRERGHDGIHSFWQEQETSRGQVLSFSVYEWNDAGEQFGANKEMGSSINANYYTADHEDVVDQVIALANRSLPDGAVFEVRAQVRPDAGMRCDYGRYTPTLEEQAARWGVAWYWKPAPDAVPAGFEDHALTQAPLFRSTVQDAECSPGGFLLIARLKAKKEVDHA